MKKILYIMLAICLLTTIIVPVAATSTGWINALEYGFKNDGTTQNDAIMAQYISNDYRTPLYFPKGVYAFNAGFNFPDSCHLELDPNAELKLTGTTVQEYFISIRRDSSRADYGLNCYIRGGVINANFMANTALGVQKVRHTYFENFIIKNVLKKGIVTWASNYSGPDSMSYYRHLLIENDRGIKGTYGVYDNGFDNRFTEVEVVNFETGFYTVCGRFNTCSAWLKDNSIIENSTFAVIDGYDIYFNSPAVDTYRYGFRINGTGLSAHISNMIWITNAGIYTSDLQTLYPRCIFNAWSNNSKFMVNGLKMNAETNISFSNISLPSSQFLNVRVPYNYDAAGTMAHFRDDGSLINDIYTAVLAVGDGIGNAAVSEVPWTDATRNSTTVKFNGSENASLKTMIMDGSIAEGGGTSPKEALISKKMPTEVEFAFENTRTIYGLRVYSDDGSTNKWSTKTAYLAYSDDGVTWISGESMTSENQTNDYFDVKFVKGGVARTITAKYVKLVVTAAYNTWSTGGEWQSKEIVVLTK